MPTECEKIDRIPRNNQSQVAGSTNQPLLPHTIAQMLVETVNWFPNHEAAVFCDSGERWTYQEFATRVDALANGLLELGLSRGDRLGLWSPNRPEWLLTQFATARLGIVLVNINPAYRTAELEYALNKVECKALISAEKFKKSNYLDMLRELAPELNSDAPGQLQSNRLPALRQVIKLGAGSAAGMLNFDHILSAGSSHSTDRLDAISATLDADDAINIQFTSGTTGSPKGATLTHHNIVNNAHFVTQAMDFNEQDRLCIPVPFYHCFGMVMGTLGCVTKGATMIVPAEGFEPLATLRAVSGEQCTALYGVPTMFVSMLDHQEFETFDISTLRTGIMAGAPCPVEVMKRVQSDMHMQQVTIAYGMTETSPVSFQSGMDDPLDKRVSSVGRIHPHVQVKILDKEGQIVPVGSQGELCTRGYSVMRGYWAEEQQTQDSIDSAGWMHTGDLATIDSQGYCNITGRVKDMIVRGGENIYPREVEEFLYRMPAIAQVQVFGLPDQKYGESVCCWIVVKQNQTMTEQGVREFCDGQIAHFKIPAIIELVDSIPMTVTGKPQKFVMRDVMINKLGLETVPTA